METNAIFADPAELEADLVLHEQVLWMRATLAERLAEAAQSSDAELLDLLRGNGMFAYSEFFYLLRARGVDSPERIAMLAEAHNAHLVALTSDAAKLGRLGLRRDRLLEAIFTADVLPRLIDGWAQDPWAIDQSNLARFMVTLMSVETCRKLSVAAAQAGFLRRSSEGGAAWLSSTGVMEQVFGAVLRETRMKIAAAIAGPPRRWEPNALA